MSLVTRVGPSVRFQGLKGTLANTKLRKGTQLFLLRDKSVDNSSSLSTLAVDKVAAKRKRDSYSGPLPVNLSSMSRKRISLLQFLVLRQSWAARQFQYVNDASRGCFLVTPSTSLPDWLYDAARAQMLAGEKMDGETKKKTIWDDVIPEGHVFEANDAHPFPLPPSDDLANQTYWKGFRASMREYQEKHALHNDMTDPAMDFTSADVTNSLRSSSSENCLLRVDPSSGDRLYLRVLRDIEQDEELLLHYGGPWWTQYLMSRLFLAASDEQLKHIRWIEALINAPNDDPIDNGEKKTPVKPFPLLKPCRTQSGEIDLGDVTTRSRATNVAVLAYALRRSCQNGSFFGDILQKVFDCSGPGSSADSRTILRPLDCVSMEKFREVVLNHLR